MKNIQKGPLIISGNAHHTLAEDIASYIGQDLTKAEVFKFNNGNLSGWETSKLPGFN